MSTLPAHRYGDSRTCGATTVVSGQNNVYVNGNLWSVRSDPNSHGSGALWAELAKGVYINNKRVNLDTDGADPDNLCPVLDSQHCSPYANEGSPDVYVGVDKTIIAPYANTILGSNDYGMPGPGPETINTPIEEAI